ncbi:MAG TPA: tetratricopeptide repeat protein [Thermopetrobacter sp.]|nr:tetratricopeptide repeat protein [Thermopetrobacter sp.]
MSDDSLIREVDEELRREQLEKLWKRYGNWFIAFSLGIVVAVAGYKGWQYYELRSARAAGEELATAMDLLARGRRDEARLRLAAIAGGSHAGAAVLARFEQASLAAADGKTEEAARLFREIAADNRADRVLRDAARVRHAWLVADGTPAEELRRLLAGLDVQNSPWGAAAREVLALAALRAGDLKEAERLLSRLLLDPTTPAGVRQRARIMLETIRPRLSAQGGAKSDDGTKGDAGGGAKKDGGTAGSGPDGSGSGAASGRK